MTSETLSRSSIDGLVSQGFGLSGVRASLKRFVQGLQVSQMCSALYRLNDAQLKAVGISRSDIPTHARKLVLEEA